MVATKKLHLLTLYNTVQKFGGLLYITGINLKCTKIENILIVIYCFTISLFTAFVIK